MMKRFFLLAFICLLCLQGWAGTQTSEVRSRLIDAPQLLQDLKTLSADEMEGRKPDTQGSAKARAYIIERFKQSGLKPFNDSYLHSFGLKSADDKTGPQGINIIGFIKGSRRPERYLIITAHYDHIGIKNDKIYNGANDNASGTAALFALAAYFHKHAPAHTLIFAALDAEESGLKGARALLSNPPVNKQELVMNVNVDMICRDEKNTLYAVGTRHYPFLKPYFDKVETKAPVTFLLGHDGSGAGEEDWTRDSDHYAFHKEKIPFIYFGVEDYKHHHKSDDDYETINPAFYVGAVELILGAVKQFDAHLETIEKQRAQHRKD